MITQFKIFEMSLVLPHLIIAIKNGNRKMVKKLIDSKFDVNCKDYMEWSPLLWAAYRRDKIIIKMLIDAGADITYKALHHISGTRKMVDFYDLCVDKYKYERDKKYKNIIKWIEEEYPEFIATKKYNI